MRCESPLLLNLNTYHHKQVEHSTTNDNMEEAMCQGGIRLAQLGEALGIRNLDPDPGMIFVTGGAGVIGHRVASQLVHQGQPLVRLGVAHPEQHINKDNEEILEEVVAFSWDQQDTYAAALEGVKSVLVTIPYHKDWHKHFPEFLQACISAGVKHFVKLSIICHSKGDEWEHVPLVKHHAKCDKLLMEAVTPSLVNVMTGTSDVTLDMSPHMSFCILYASHLMSNPFLFFKNELTTSRTPATFYGASANHGVNYVSPNDVAEVAVRILLEPKAHYNTQYTLTGSMAITDQQVASFLGKHLNKAVMYVDQPLHEFEFELKAHGIDEWMVNDLVELERLKQSGTEEDNETFVTNDIETICHRPPETLEEYLSKKYLMSKLELIATPEPMELAVSDHGVPPDPPARVEAAA